MSRDYAPFLDDIRLSCERITRYTTGLSYEQFLADEKTYDAVLRHLTIIGEAAKQIPTGIQVQHPGIEWRRIARFRDIVVHHYFAIDNQIVWDIVANKVPELLAQLSESTEEVSPPDP